MVTAWQQDRRRDRKMQWDSENARALAAILGGLGDLDERQILAEDRAMKADLADRGLAVREKQAETSLLRAKRGEGDESPQLLRARAAADEAGARQKLSEEKLLRERRDDAEKRGLERVRQQLVGDQKTKTGGISRSDLEKEAAAAGVDPDVLLARADAATDEEMAAKAAADAKTGATEALTEVRETQAAKNRRVPAPKAPKEPPNMTVKAQPLRKEFQALPAVKDAAAASSNYETLVNASKDPSAAGDLALIFTFMKILDPGSVVKETEFANAQNAAGVDDRIRNQWNRTLSGERLSTAQRQDFLKQAAGLRDQAQARADAAIAQYTALATRSGFSPEDVVGAPRQAPPAAAPATPAQAAAKVKVRKGNETLEIDAADVGEALADGYKVVR